MVSELTQSTKLPFVLQTPAHVRAIGGESCLSDNTRFAGSCSRSIVYVVTCAFSSDRLFKSDNTSRSLVCATAQRHLVEFKRYKRSRLTARSPEYLLGVKANLLFAV